MGANTHLQSIFQKGYKAAASAAAALDVTIDPLPGYRIAVTDFAFTSTANGSGYAAFRQVNSRGKVGTTNIASGGTSIGMTGSTWTSTLAFASGHYVCVALKNGLYQFTTASNYWASTDTVVVGDVLQASVAAGASVWGFGLVDTTGHPRYACTAVTQTRVGTYGGAGIYFGAAKGDPMVVSYPVATAAATFDFISGGYITA